MKQFLAITCLTLLACSQANACGGYGLGAAYFNYYAPAPPLALFAPPVPPVSYATYQYQYPLLQPNYVSSAPAPLLLPPTLYNGFSYGYGGYTLGAPFGGRRRFDYGIGHGRAGANVFFNNGVVHHNGNRNNGQRFNSVGFSFNVGRRY
jgi:hypothetical protein